MTPIKGRGVTWASIQKQPIYGAIWEILQSGPKTFPQLRTSLEERRRRPIEPLLDKLLPGTLVKRLHNLRRAGLVGFESRSEVLRRWEEAGLFHPDGASKRGRHSGGAWWLDSVAAFPVQVALAHSDQLTKTPTEDLVVERTGNGVDLLIAGSNGENVRWWYPARFDGKLGVLFELLDRIARELCRSVLAKDREAVAAQENLRETVKTHWSSEEQRKTHPLNVPEIRAAVDEANQHHILVTVGVYPAHWWDGDLPIELTSKAEVTLVRIHERTKPESMPVHAVSPEEAARWAEQGHDMSGGWTVERPPTRHLRRGRPAPHRKRRPSSSTS